MIDRILLVFILLCTFLNSSAQLDSLLKYNAELQNIYQKDSVQRQLFISELKSLNKNELVKRNRLATQIMELDKRDSLNKKSIQEKINLIRKTAKGYPVKPFRDTIIHIFTKIGKLTPSERAQIITLRLKNLYKDFGSKSDSLAIVDTGQTIDIMYKDHVLMSITDADALWFEKSKSDLALNYRTIIYTDINSYKIDTSLLIRQLLFALIVTFLSAILIRLVNLLFNQKIKVLIENQRGKRIRGVKIRNYQFLDEEKSINVLMFLAKLMRWFLYIILIYAMLLTLFSILPHTQPLAEALFSYVTKPAKRIGLAIIDYLPNLFTIIVIVIIIRYIIKLLKYLALEIEEENLKIPGFYPDWAKPTFNIIRLLMYIFMFIVVFPYLPGSSSPVFQGVSVFVGIVFSLGSSSIISNMVAGLVMTYMRPFQLGDRIKVGEIVGDVIEKTPFVTRIKTPKNEFVTVPNSNILSSNVVNYNTSKQQQGIILFTTVSLGYENPWKEVHEALIEAGLRTEYILKEPSPFVLQTSLDDFYVSYQLNVYSLEPNKQADIYSKLHQNIQDVCNERGIEILSPHYRAQRDGNATATPQQYLPNNYEPQAFRVKNCDK